MIANYSGYGVWVGANDIENETVWTWSDGQPWLNGTEWDEGKLVVFF